jgi:hypothetical protein
MGPGPGWPTRTRMCGRQHALGERDCPGPAASPRWPLSVGPAPLVFLTRISRCQCDSTRTRGRCLGPAFCEPAGGRRPRRARGLDHSHWRWRWHPLAGRHAGTVTVTATPGALACGPLAALLGTASASASVSGLAPPVLDRDSGHWQHPDSDSDSVFCPGQSTRVD